VVRISDSETKPVVFSLYPSTPLPLEGSGRFI
jgi:hypothetical protein